MFLLFCPVGSDIRVELFGEEPYRQSPADSGIDHQVVSSVPRSAGLLAEPKKDKSSRLVGNKPERDFLSQDSECGTFAGLFPTNQIGISGGHHT
jgi:hypothetical protein